MKGTQFYFLLSYMFTIGFGIYFLIIIHSLPNTDTWESKPCPSIVTDINNNKYNITSGNCLLNHSSNKTMLYALDIIFIFTFPLLIYIMWITAESM